MFHFLFRFVLWRSARTSQAEWSRNVYWVSKKLCRLNLHPWKTLSRYLFVSQLSFKVHSVCCCAGLRLVDRNCACLYNWPSDPSARLGGELFYIQPIIMSTGKQNTKISDNSFFKTIKYNTEFAVCVGETVFTVLFPCPSFFIDKILVCILLYFFVCSGFMGCSATRWECLPSDKHEAHFEQFNRSVFS